MATTISFNEVSSIHSHITRLVLSLMQLNLIKEISTAKTILSQPKQQLGFN